ncbi:MAG: bifunctional protein-serine/threonine kinase/phosphatase [Candidatus Accumulibacter sp.]|jgi:serine/threonine protein phosphatase PrpC|uniref:bifunctional protein-serine/threonine kinase/phosphatase n=1 Tax=unclassified Candidatus Accumulibacter TaxID=2619054 RepID=UPI001A422B3B|nr:MULTISPECIES: bifunctional protein-serine/threonine kinase/phosphatase [unclassified Candidatus Accumulibacter]MBL8367537.1 bifunctional protein-serine/threonine kinase/phosphatase [Accumulibacter sp.]
MSSKLTLTAGQYSAKGRKEINQDFHGLCIPDEPLLGSKGIAIALADGISSSDVGHVASESAIKSFLDDYYCTSEAWSVKSSAQRVLSAANSWLYAQSRHSQYRYDMDRGYVCTLSALIIKSNTAHIFHVGDSRVYRLRDAKLEQLTDDHRLVVSAEQSYLSRALGISPQLEIDYLALQAEEGDVFILATDGVHEFAAPPFIITAIREAGDDLDAAARRIAEEAYTRGSKDNLTAQIVRIETLPGQAPNELYQQLAELPPAPVLEARMLFEGYRIIRQVHGSSRSHVYLAEDVDSGALVIVKTPSIDLRDDPAYLERFMLEEWIARRINSAHVLKPCAQTRKRHSVYVVSEYIEGQTLAQWMVDNPAPELETVRAIVEQIARGLLAFHRLEMLHQDLRPNNIMIDASGTVKIIDFGAARVSGLAEAGTANLQPHILGTVQYTAPEYFLGEAGRPCSDLFSLGVIAYQMLSGRLPYGAEVAKSRTRAAQRKLQYQSVLDEQREIPAWIDAALAKAVHPDPNQRYAELSEFTHDLRHPNPALLKERATPLIDRNPLRFWQGLSFVLAVLVLALLSSNTLVK